MFPQQLREATRRRVLDFLPDSLLFLAVGGLYSADVLGEQRIRWVMYIFSPIRVVLPSLGLEFLLAELSTVSFCPFQSFLALSEVLVVINDVSFVGVSTSMGLPSILSSASMFGFAVFLLVPLLPMVPKIVLDL